MTTDLEQRLRDALHEDAERARLVNPDGPPVPDVPPLIVDGFLRRWPLRMVAVAAVIALIAAVGALTLLDDDQKVDTTPVTEAPVVPDPRTTVNTGECPFGIAGDPVVVQDVPAGLRFAALAGQSVAYTTVGEQAVVVSVPGYERATDQTWQDEAIELERGPATLWLDGPEGAAVTGGLASFVQVRYFPGSEAPCGSFTVSVEGGGADQQRETAIDFAERVILPTDVDGLAELELAGTQWMFVDTSAGPVSADMAFGADSMEWDTGCERLGASYELDRDAGVLILTDVEHVSGTCGPPTTFGMTPHYPIIDAVMGAGRIPITLDDARLYLGEHPDGDYLVLGPSVQVDDSVQVDPPALPGPGEQPAEPGTAEEQVRAAFTGLYDASVPREDRAQFVDRPDVWLPLNQAIFESEWGEVLHDLHAVVDDVVFTSPTHASVRFRLLAEGLGTQVESVIGHALLSEGRWVVAATTPCYTAQPMGFTCDFTP